MDVAIVGGGHNGLVAACYLMQAAGGWPGAHPMHLDLDLDQLGPFRPTGA